MAWLFLTVAISFEIAATSFLGKTQGFTKAWWTLGVLGGYGVSLFMLAQAVRTLEIGVVYAVWSGVGTAAIAAVGIVFLGENLSVPKLFGIGLIVGGVLVLNLLGGHHAPHR